MTEDHAATGQPGTDESFAPPSLETALLSPGEADEPEFPAARAEEVSDSILRALVAERLSYDLTKEEAFQRLYSDLEHYRALTNSQFFRPLYLDLILLLDRLEAGLGGLPPGGEGRALLESLQAELEEVLARRGVERMEVLLSAFDAQRQRAVEVVATEDLSEHLTVARVVRPGYEADGAVIRAADVMVRRLATRDGEAS
jgi:molecular chaperone GrpE